MTRPQFGTEQYLDQLNNEQLDILAHWENSEGYGCLMALFDIMQNSLKTASFDRRPSGPNGDFSDNDLLIMGNARGQYYDMEHTRQISKLALAAIERRKKGTSIVKK